MTTIVHFHCLDINDLGCIGECVGLERLNLSRNDITKLYALAGLSQLSHLNLSCNRIQSLGKKLFCFRKINIIKEMKVEITFVSTIFYSQYFPPLYNFLVCNSDGLQSLDNLKSLNLAGNLIGR